MAGMSKAATKTMKQRKTEKKEAKVASTKAKVATQRAEVTAANAQPSAKVTAVRESLANTSTSTDTSKMAKQPVISARTVLSGDLTKKRLKAAGL